MTQRDLKADLELCNKATPGPWVFNGISVLGAHGLLIARTPNDADAEFIAQAREGWPHAIDRAMRAEAEVEQLKGEIEQLLEIAFAHIPDVMWRHGYYVDANPEEDSEE